MVAGDKSRRGALKGKKKFYDELIVKADACFDAHLKRLRG